VIILLRLAAFWGILSVIEAAGTQSRKVTSPHAPQAGGDLSTELIPLKSENALPGTGAPVLPSDLLTVDQLAKRLHVSAAWVYDKTKKGSLHPIPVLRLGHFVRFDWAAVCEWMRGKAA